MGNAVHLSAIRCFPFLFLKHSPSYRQRKRSLGSARDDDTGRTRFPHILCMMHGIYILHTIISSVARNEDSGRIFSQRKLYTIQRISIPPHCHFERSEKSFSSPFSHDSFAKPFMGNTVHLSAIRYFPFPAIRRSPSYHQRKRSLGPASDDATGRTLFPHILCMMHGIAIPHAVISSVARNLFRPSFPFSFAKPFTGNTVHLSATRCFPFLAVRHSPSYRQRKRPLGSASNDDTGNVLFPHILCMMHGIAIPHAVISSVARNLFRPSFPSSFAKPFTGNTVRLSSIRYFPFPAIRRSPSYRQRKRSLDFASDDDTRNAPFPLPVIRCFPFLAVKHAPSYRQRKRSLGSASDDDTGNRAFPTNSLYDARDSHPPRCHFERSEKSFSSPFSLTSSLSRLRETPSPSFRDTMFPVPRCQTRSVLPSTKKIPRLRTG